MTETSGQIALGAEDEQESETEGRPPLTLIVGLVLALLGGMVLVGAAGALETTDDCSSGGYNCVDYEDAQLFVEPATNLVDRQTVQVTGTDFDPHFATMGVAQCATEFVEESLENACFIPGSRIITVDESGSVATELTVRRIITTAAGGETDCAEPNACEISGGTFEGAFEPLEGDRVPVHFDPTVPPVPPLELEITVDDATADSITGTVSCNRAATINLDAQLVQERGNRTASAYGYFYGDTGCDTEPAPWTVQLMPGDQRLVGGPATATVYGYAYDDFESVFEQVEQSVRLRGGSRQSFVPINVEGDSISVRILGQPTDGGIIVQVDCGRPSEYVSVSAAVMQWAGLDRVSAYGYGTIDDCDGVEEIILTLSANDGVLVGGPAQVQAAAEAHNYGPDDFYHDFAQTTEEVTLSGQIRPEVFEPEPNPDSRIAIDQVTRTAITGTVECESPVIVDLSGTVIQAQGRDVEYSSAYSFIECDGTTSFSLDIAEYGNPPQGGQASVAVSAYAYQIVEMDDYDYYEYVWDDHQQASLQVRNR